MAGSVILTLGACESAFLPSTSCRGSSVTSSVKRKSNHSDCGLGRAMADERNVRNADKKRREGKMKIIGIANVHTYTRMSVYRLRN